MKTLFTLMFLCLYVVGHGQDPASTAKGWMLGFGISPDIAYRTLKDKGEPYSSNHISMRNEIERPRMGYSAGFYANYILNDWLGLGTGLLYSVKGYEVAKHWMDLQDMRTFIYYEPHYRQGIYTFKYIDIPLTAMITLGKGRLRSISHVGVAGSLLWGANYSFTDEYIDGRSHSWRSPVSQPFKVMDLSAMISTGVSYRMTNKLDIRLEPNFRHAILSSRNSAYATTLFWNAGINVSAFLDLR